jgi:hypothetical protein
LEAVKKKNRKTAAMTAVPSFYYFHATLMLRRFAMTVPFAMEGIIPHFY